MTEEIIIDGVDVAGCEFYLQDEKYSCDLSFINQEELCKCDDVQDCTYKQLKRLEQENKELKKQHYETLKMLKHEYDGRQRDNEQWFTRCTENHNEDSKIIEKYRSALEEIEQYMKNASKATIEEEAHREFRKVVSKINEVLNG